MATPDRTDSSRLDQAVLCWPGEREAALRGWSLRTGSSPALRANSAFPYSGDADTSDETLASIEVFFRERARVPAIRIAPFGPSAALDARLEEADYALLEPTVVMTAAIPAAATLDPTVVFVDRDEDWLERLAAVGEHPPRIRGHYAVVLPRAPEERIRIAVEVEGQTVAVALGLCVDGWLGVFDLVTAPEHRGRGHARRALRGLLAEAALRDLGEAFLYVTASNERALGLYTGLGFREAYTYHYRVLT